MKHTHKNGILTLVIFALAQAAQSLFGGNSRYVAAANTYDAARLTHECAVNRTNDAAITARHLLWKKGSADGGVALNGANDIPLGTIDNTESSTGMDQSVKLLGKGSTKLMVASEAITAGEQVYTAASGKVQDLPAGAGTYYKVGTALTAAGADGDLIEVADCNPTAVVVS